MRYAKDRETAKVTGGTWNIQRFNKAKRLEKWAIVDLSEMPNLKRTDLMDKFVGILQTIAMEVGMKIEPRRSCDRFKSNPLDNMQITQYFSKNKGLELIIVVIPNRENAVYAKVKKIAELDVGVLTQCMKYKTWMRIVNYNESKHNSTKHTVTKNILLKINAKLNGINHTFDIMPKCLNEEIPCMLVGADVTHPDSKNPLSIAAVTANIDKSAFRYNVAFRRQQPKEEMILDLEEIILAQLRVYQQETGRCPKRIVYYRDGVSEGQLPQVMYYEIGAIKKAVTKFTRGSNIEINCLVVQKRHHVRLFPKSTNISDAKDTRNYNVKAGTIVDTTITHPEQIDFYLVSHASVRGIVRPTRYRCICNESKFTQDELQQLTYHLCHLCVRHARALSYPAPAHLAHLAAYRARNWILAQRQNPQNQDWLSNLESDQKVLKSLMEKYPMFFP